MIQFWVTLIGSAEGMLPVKNLPRAFYRLMGAVLQVRTLIKRTGEAMRKLCRILEKRSTQLWAFSTTLYRSQEKIANLLIQTRAGGVAQLQVEMMEVLDEPSLLQMEGYMRLHLAVRKRSECQQ